MHTICHIDQRWYSVGRNYKRYEYQDMGIIGGHHEDWPLWEPLSQFGCSTLSQLHAYLNTSYICLAPT